MWYNRDMTTTIEIDGHIFKLSSNQGTVLKINTHDFKIGMDDGTVITIPRTEMVDPDFEEGDIIKLYKDGREFILKPVVTATGNNAATNIKRNTRKVNKHVFVWVGAFLLGWFGVDRFMRGQIGIGILKIFVGPYTLFIWDLIDWVIAMSKAYGAYSDKEYITFNANGDYTK